MKRYLFAILLILCLCVTACGEEAGERVTNVYSSEKIELPEGMALSRLYDTSNGCAALCFDGTAHRLLGLDSAGKQDGEDILPYGNGEIYDLTILPDGGVVCLIDSKDGIFSVVRHREGGAEVLCDDLEALYERENVRFSLTRIMADGDGDLCLIGQSALVMLDGEGGFLFSLTISDTLESVYPDGSGRLIVCTYEKVNFTRSCRAIDKEARDFGEETALVSDLMIDDGNNFYSWDSKGLYGYDAVSGTTTLLCDWVNSDLNHYRIEEISVLGADTMILRYRRSMASDSESDLLYMERIPDDQVPAKNLIRVAGTYCDMYLYERAAEFNRESDEYRVVIDIYGYGEDDALRNDILAGRVPDVMIFQRDFSGSSKYHDAYIDANTFTDLYALMDADPDFDRSQITAGAMRSLERGGKLYELPTSVYIRTLTAKGANVPAEGWTLREFLDWAKALEGAVVMEADKEELLEVMLTCSMGEFVDWENGTCSFDSDLFRHTLEFAATADCNVNPLLTSEEREYAREDKGYVHREGKVMLRLVKMPVLTHYMFAQHYYWFDDVCFVGFPSNDGNGTQIAALASYAIAERSEVKEGAWEFLKYLLLNRDEYMGDLTSTVSGIRSAFAEMGGRHYYYTYGRYNGYKSCAWDRDPAELYDLSQGIVHDYTDEDCEKFLALMDGAGTSTFMDSTLMEIVMEEVQMYFAGDKTLDETVKIIQGRAGIYVSEQS
ncbi:MAG: extracellular solute-binding protein [Clostridia bacterium]|nr:extracellular solute-binding protein [Clostridia bacterium]